MIERVTLSAVVDAPVLANPLITVLVGGALAAGVVGLLWWLNRIRLR